MIGPIHAYTIVDSSYKAWLPGWLHWHRERYDRLFVMLLDGDEECRRLIRWYGAEEMVNVGSHGHGVMNPREFITDRYRFIYHHAMNFGTRSWYSVIDVDEIVDPRVDTRSLAHWCQRRDRVVAFAHMIDRVAVDGLPSALGSPETLFEDFPVRICFGERLTGWSFHKPFLRRSDLCGLHRVDNIRQANANGCHIPFELCHFDFTDQTAARCHHKLSEAKRRWVGWWRQYQVLAEACATGLDVASLQMPPRDYDGDVHALGDDEGRAVFGALPPLPLTSPS